jgi:hypothetical protein
LRGFAAPQLLPPRWSSIFIASWHSKDWSIGHMGKLIITLVLAVVAWFMVKALIGKSRKQTPPEGEKANVAERMVKCARCGVFLPESETMQRDGATTCRTPEQCLRRERA